MNESTNQKFSRPNIRIEIKNVLAEEAMEVDAKDADGEDGEIFDYNDMDYMDPEIKFLARPTTNDITEEENMVVASTQQKLSERAKRFALDQNEIHNFSEEQLNSVCESLGITTDDPNVRYEAVYLYSIGINLEDCLKYFSKYSPIKIEWISKNTCNITWNESISAAKALYHLSKSIAGLPVKERTNPLLNANREIEMDGECEEKEGGVHVRDIKASVPPGYWRLGNHYYKMKYLLMRFSLQQDNKPYKIELFDSINFNFYVDRSRPSVDDDLEDEDKNPWGNLARNWYEDAKYAEPDYKNIEDEEVKRKSNLQHRLGFKRAIPVEEPEYEEKEEVEKKSKIPRMRMYADEEEAKIKRRQELKTQVMKPENKTDLRTILNLNVKNVVVERVVEVDLGAKLKNRKNRTVNKIPEEILTKPVINTDARSKLNKLIARRTHEDTVQKSERYRSNRNKSRGQSITSNYSDDFEDYTKTSSKVAVVIKKQKSPAVASTVWSRINEKDRLKIVSEGKLKGRYESSGDSTSSSSSSSSSESESDVEDEPKPVFHRIGFNNSKTNNTFRSGDHKSPLRIEISNNHFRKN